ncbi:MULTISPECIES: DUF6242 domain-containing protein [Dysgonomonas]|uniref:Uncharacterized protein n=1 Tax=Dysgonomonas gadei ATCC BAA-286 TaxID=742766 RepID=F5J1Z4_9BACT|nr:MULTISPECIES: DUF6242 domain-containing protein [Dysgonomonas]EGK00250.1 hypothetical protein HMPREF9455_03389 [Dysgonomonas gadei ATCC BAA-286]MBF0650695.1 hypothetical protein [Dysgonomonas sp. GY75]
MRLKQITKLLFIFLSVFALSSCNDSSSEYDTSALSGDSQISSFKIAALPYTAIDTVNYPSLATTRFSIDQFSRLIYNADSLPYQTTLRKCAVTLSYAAGGIGKVELVYPKDSVVDWNTTDSVDFSTYLYPKFRITPYNGQDPREYTVKILVHKVDPDTLVWKEKVVTNYPASFNKQKTILIGDTVFYTFTTGSDNKVYLSKADKPEKAEDALSYGNKEAVSTLDASTLVLESITFFNNKFYAVDQNKQGYVADINGKSWSKEGISNNVTNIVGVIPTLDAATDLLLVVTGDQFATTTDLKTLVAKGTIDSDFPTTGYSSLTHNDRSNLNNCILAVTKNISPGYVKTWSIKIASGNSLQVASNQSNPVIPKKDGVVTFLYNGYMYALTGNSFYKTLSYGYKWTTAPNKEILDTRIPKASGQSVIVDDENYIWVFGGVPDSGTSPIQKVWIGRINKLRTKL